MVSQDQILAQIQQTKELLKRTQELGTFTVPTEGNVFYQITVEVNVVEHYDVFQVRSYEDLIRIQNAYSIKLCGGVHSKHFRFTTMDRTFFVNASKVKVVGYVQTAIQA